MIHASREDLSKIDCGGGYGIPEECSIYIDSTKPLGHQRLTAVHEVLELHLKGRIKHSKLDTISIDIIDALIQLGFIK